MYKSLACVLMFFSSQYAIGKAPTCSLYRYEYWAKSSDQILSLNNYVNEDRPVSFKTCSLSDMNLEKAWDISTGSRDVIVAVIDNGFRDQHESYRENIWINKGEIGLDAKGLDKQFNQVDDDANGFIDDIHGFNFRGNNGDTNQYLWSVDNNQRGSIESNWHSVSALGIIGASGNHTNDIAGINWKISMMLLKVSDINGAGFKDPEFAENVSRAIRYATNNGAKIINWSGFVDEKHYLLNPARRKLLVDAFKYAEDKGVLIVVAAGNSHVDLDVNAQKEPFPQRDVDLPNLVYAAETTPCGTLSSFSNFGKKRVKFAAPAENAISSAVTVNGYDTYGLAAGTSTAAPMVSGVAALMLSVRPDFTYRQIEEVLCHSTRKLEALKSKIQCGGVIDAGAAMLDARDYIK